MSTEAKPRALPQRCPWCKRPTLGQYCSPMCAAAAVTKEALARGWFPASERAFVENEIYNRPQKN